MWKYRFDSQALLDDAALLQCVAYNDLNPIRAKMAKTPEASEYTSIKRRLEVEIHKLMPFWVSGQADLLDHIDVIPFSFQDYLELVDWYGRAIIKGKRGSIPTGYPPILERLG